MISEFKDFIARGSMIDLAVGFVMGAAFTAVVNSLVENVVMPIIAIPFGEPSFHHITWEVGDSVIAIGSFITALVAFLMVALALFLFVVKPYNAARARREAADDGPPEPTELELLTEIRDALRK